MTQEGKSARDDRYGISRILQRRAHDRIPGGCHTYAKGDDQYPLMSPGFIARGKGCRVWDVDGNEFIELAMGLRSVVLGHAFPEVTSGVREALDLGSNFNRPAPIEVDCAEALLQIVKCADMVKFAKNGSDVTTAAVKLARAATGRDMVGICSDQPFFSVDDWFIGTTAMGAGIPKGIRELTVSFRYNDLDSIRSIFREFQGRIAALVLEPATTEEPAPGFLPGVRRICDEEGALLIFDEMITGFRWALGGAQCLYGVEPDLSTFGKALANGFSVSALLGRREIMEMGGLRHEGERVFLLSTTHGGETHALAAALATIRVYEREGVIGVLHRQGQRLRLAVEQVIDHRRLDGFFQVLGRESNLVFATRDQNGERSQVFRALFMQELLRRGVIAPSFVVSFSHDDSAIDEIVEAVDGALEVYAQALDEGPERFLVGDPVKPVFRRFN